MHPLVVLFMQLVIGGAMIATTVMIQAVSLDLIIRHAQVAERFLIRFTGFMWKPLMSGAVVVSIFAVQVVNIWLWAALYLLHDCTPLKALPDALYFATVTYTTLGYGDITLGESCRMLSGIEGANGFMLFGWTTAFVFEVISQLYRREARSIQSEK